MSIVGGGIRHCPGCKRLVTVENIIHHMDCLEGLMTALTAATDRESATVLAIDIEVNEERLTNSLENYREGMESLMAAYGEGIRRHNREALREYGRGRVWRQTTGVAIGAFIGSFIGLGLANLLF